MWQLCKKRAIKGEIMRNRIMGIIAIIVVLPLILGMTAFTNETQFAAPESQSSSVLTILDEARAAIEGIEDLDATEKQAAIDEALGIINNAVTGVNTVLATAQEAVTSANAAATEATTAVTSAIAAAAAAEEALVVAEAVEEEYTEFIEEIIDALNYPASRVIVNLENAVTNTWNAFATARNNASALAKAAAEAASDAEASVAEVESAIALAVAAQAAVNELSAAWLAAEAALAAVAEGTLYNLAATRLQTRSDAATTHIAAVEALIYATETLLEARGILAEASEIRTQVLAYVQDYLAEIEALYEELSAFAITITTPPSGVFQAPPPGWTPPDSSYTTTLSRIVFSPIPQWGGDGTNILLNFDITPGYLISVEVQAEGGTAQMNDGSPTGANVGWTQNVPLFPRPPLVITDEDGLPRSISTMEPDVRIMVTVSFYIDPVGTPERRSATQTFWATGTLQNTAGGTFHINDLSPYPPQGTTTTLTVGDLAAVNTIPDLVGPELMEIEIRDLFLATLLTLETPGQEPPPPGDDTQQTQPPVQQPPQDTGDDDGTVITPIDPITPGPAPQPGPGTQPTPIDPGTPAQTIDIPSEEVPLAEAPPPLAETPESTEGQPTRRVNPQTSDEYLSIMPLMVALAILSLAALVYKKLALAKSR